MLPFFRKPGWLHLSLLVGIGVVMFLGSSRLHSATPLPGSVAATQKLEWNRYTIKGGEFSVLLPKTPAMTTYELRSELFGGARVRHIIGAYSEGVVYAIYVAERKQSLQEYIGQSRYSSPTDSKREVKIGDFTGQEYAVQDADIKRVAQYFITKRYLYSFIAQGSTLGKPDRDIPRFFDSIKFEPDANEIAIVNGPGEQSESDAAAVAGGEARIISGKEATRKARVVTKPQPSYTEMARKNGVTGTVVLRCVFSSSGAVTNIRAMSGLPNGLTEQAIAAAQQIRFIPAIKEEHFVSMYIQLEYNFNLY